MKQELFLAALAAFDKANADDPNKEFSNDTEFPKELLYALRMSEMQQRYVADASEELQLALRAQHIQRWMIPRSSYPMDRQGYLHWRTRLYSFHAESAGNILKKIGYGDEIVARVMAIVGKRGLKINAETQLLEDVVNLVFIEHYLADFVARHPEYDEQKWLTIFRKTWQKMSPRAHEFALTGNIKIPPSMQQLILKAVHD